MLPPNMGHCSTTLLGRQIRRPDGRLEVGQDKAQARDQKKGSHLLLLLVFEILARGCLEGFVPLNDSGRRGDSGLTDEESVGSLHFVEPQLSSVSGAHFLVIRFAGTQRSIALVWEGVVLADGGYS